jgi:hypothetical protein
MKTLIVVALVATSFPVFAVAATSEDGGTARERRVCTQANTARAGSRMSPRRVCRTPTQWREALGPDWRQHISGRTVQEDYEALQVRASPVDTSTTGIQPSRSFGAPR